MKITSATCTGAYCYGRILPGAPLRCPYCGSSQLLYTYAKQPVAAVAAR